MAFKMRSGNKSSFKDMGSSPAKNTINLGSKLNTETELYTPKIGSYKRQLDRDASDAAQQKVNEEAIKNAKQDEKIKKNSKKIKPTKAEEETAARKSRTESMNSMPWNKDVKEKLADKTKTATSKREQRANYKAAKENAREDGKITKEERRSINRDRDKVRQETAAAKGTQSLSFNLKNAVLGGQGLQAGFDIGSKAEKIQAKMDRQDANRTSKAKAKATKKETNNKATERRSKTTIGRINNKVREGITGLPGKVVKAVKNAVKPSKTKPTTVTPTTVTPTVAPTTTSTTSTTKKTTVKKKQNQNEGNDPKNEITIKPNKVRKTYDGSKTTTPPPNVEKEVKEADAKKPKALAPTVARERSKGNLVVNQELMNKKVPKIQKPVATVENKTTPKPVVKKSTNEKVSLNSKTSGPRAVVKKKVKEVLVKSNKMDYANSLLKK